MRLQLLDVELGLLPDARPDNRFPLPMDLQHEFFGLGLRIPKDTAQHHGHEAHIVNRIIMDQDIPGRVEPDIPLCFNLYVRIVGNQRHLNFFILARWRRLQSGKRS